MNVGMQISAAVLTIFGILRFYQQPAAVVKTPIVRDPRFVGKKPSQKPNSPVAELSKFQRLTVAGKDSLWLHTSPGEKVPTLGDIITIFGADTKYHVDAHVRPGVVRIVSTTTLTLPIEQKEIGYWGKV